MELLERRILSEGEVLPGNVIKVGSFLNHQIDVSLLLEMGKEVNRLFADAGVTKILTVEASGIAIATAFADGRARSVCQKARDKQSVGRYAVCKNSFVYS